MVYTIYSALFVVAWVAGGIVGWLSGYPSRGHVVIILAWSFILPLSWLGGVHLCKMIFWEKVPVTGSSGIQLLLSSGLAWEYRRKQK